MKRLEILNVHDTVMNIISRLDRFCKTVPFPFMPFLLDSIRERVDFFSRSNQRNIEKKVTDILIVHEKIRKNTFLQVKANLFSEKMRIWMNYSLDEGKNWNQEPLKKKEDGFWYSAIQVSDHKDLLYRLFIGPDHLEHPNPLEELKAWQETNDGTFIRVPSAQMTRAEQSGSFEKVIPSSICPNWDWTPLDTKRTEKLISYSKLCDDFSLTAGSPDSIIQYEKSYAELEKSLKTTKISGPTEEKAILEGLKEFVQSEIGIEPSSIVPIKGGLGFGLSGDCVYKVLDAQSRPIYVIKVFLNSKGKLSREFKSLMNLERLELKSLDSPRVRGIGALEYKDRKIPVLMTDYQEGDSVYQLFEQLLSFPKTSIGRREVLKRLEEVYHRIGLGLSEFHKRFTVKELSEVHPVIYNLIELFGTNCFKVFDEKLDKNFVDQLRVFFNKRLPALAQDKIQSSFFHGDIHPGNFIFDWTRKKLSLIDWPDASFSVGKNGVPMGISCYDQIQLFNDLDSKRALGLKEEEIHTLKKSFFSGYEKLGIPFASQSWTEFLTALDLMGGIKWFYDKKHRFLDSNDLSKAEKIQKAKLEKLKELIEADAEFKLASARIG